MKPAVFCARVSPRQSAATRQASTSIAGCGGWVETTEARIGEGYGELLAASEGRDNQTDLSDFVLWSHPIIQTLPCDGEFYWPTATLARFEVVGVVTCVKIVTPIAQLTY